LKRQAGTNWYYRRLPYIGRVVVTLLAVLLLSPFAFGETQTFTAMHTYILGDHDSKDDARHRCLLEVKRKILEQAGVYIESASEVQNFDLTKDRIASVAGAVMQVKDIKEEVGFQHGHMTLKLTLRATVDSAEVQKLQTARQADQTMRDTVASQQERLTRIETQLQAMMQRQLGGQPSGSAPASSPIEVTEKDLQAWRTRADGGDRVAQYFLGLEYFLGQDVPQDYSKAYQWFEKAAAQGYADAQLAMGVAYENGFGTDKDDTKARQWYEKAAFQNSKEAKYCLGLLYLKGQGVPQNYAKAHEWFEKAAAQGYPDAQYNIAWQYANGQGAPKNDRKAAEWLQKAAAQGIPRAQIMLATLYAQGRGVPKDYATAYMWLTLGLAKGAEEDSFAEFRDILEESMTSAQLAKAQRLTQQCQARKFKDC